MNDGVVSKLWYCDITYSKAVVLVSTSTVCYGLTNVRGIVYVHNRACSLTFLFSINCIVIAGRVYFCYILD